MKIAFLMFSAYGQAGTSVATQTLANSLAARQHDVELVSLFQYHDVPPLRYAPGVSLRSLMDTRNGSADLDEPLHLIPSPHCAGYKPDDRNRYSRLVDERVAAYLAGCDADVVIATAPNTVTLLAVYGTGAYITLGQAHTHYHHQSAGSRKVLDAAIPKLDAFVTVTSRDAQTHQDAYGAVGTVFHAIPNATTGTALRSDVRSSRIVTSSGRMVDWKRFDLLITAFAQLGRIHPDWTLRIFGSGAEKPALRKQIDDLGANDRILLMGHTKHLREELAKAALHTSASTDETFGLTIVEAMTCGVPVLSTAGPHGPSEIITDGVDGKLSPVGDADAFAKNLDLLMSDAELRARLGVNALEASARYSPEEQAKTYENLLAGLLTARDFRPEALCRSTPAGDLEFAVDPASAPGGHFTVLCVNEADGRQALLAAQAERGVDGRLYAVVPARLRLAPGTWNVLLRREDDGVMRRVKVRELQQSTNSLISSPAHTGPVRFRTVTRSDDSCLQIVSREFAAHAEVLSVETAGPHLTVRLYALGVAALPGGPQVDLAGGGAQVIAQSRKNADAQVLIPCAFSDGSASFTVDLQQYGDRMIDLDTIWDLSLSIPGNLTVSGESYRLRLGRFGDEILKRKPVNVYPKRTVTTSGGRAVAFHPYYTDSNYLSIGLKLVS
ncbi:glycosyltransferase [Streptomyces sp. NBC_00102]|uniref:glycosyltransferase n=1 Tax=Streptomyces sp. NBC_00102 TaxID=2975652 RepID=UPI00225B7274|nr:glycosyltransferase [Streptomyces sp. NBC_00102]MCX5400515.1 glycosyltransferase [Streptomyces sp. NBC_00102]